jgi:hypothetical protein
MTIQNIFFFLLELVVTNVKRSKVMVELDELQRDCSAKLRQKMRFRECNEAMTSETFGTGDVGDE